MLPTRPTFSSPTPSASLNEQGSEEPGALVWLWCCPAVALRTPPQLSAPACAAEPELCAVSHPSARRAAHQQGHVCLGTDHVLGGHLASG